MSRIDPAFALYQIQMIADGFLCRQDLRIDDTRRNLSIILKETANV